MLHLAVTSGTSREQNICNLFAMLTTTELHAQACLLLDARICWLSSSSCREHESKGAAGLQHGRSSLSDVRRCALLPAGQQEKKSQALPEVHAQFERSKQASAQASEQNALDQGDMDSGAAVSDEEEDDANDYRLPISHEAALEGGRPAGLLHAACFQRH